MSARSKPVDYQTLSLELDTILSQLQQSDISVDQAVKLYEQGLQVVTQLETYVANAEHTLEAVRVQAQAGDAS